MVLIQGQVMILWKMLHILFFVTHKNQPLVSTWIFKCHCMAYSQETISDETEQTLINAGYNGWWQRKPLPSLLSDVAGDGEVQNET
jgi:hypothetical protein